MKLSQFVGTTGSKNWTMTTANIDYYDHLVAARGNYVYCHGTGEETLQKRNRSDGSLVWQRSFNIGRYTQPNKKILVDTSQNIYTTKDGVIYKYDSDGNISWSYDTGESLALLQDLSRDYSKILVYAGGALTVLSSAGSLVQSIPGSETIQLAGNVFDSEDNVLVCEGSSPNYKTKKYSILTASEIWSGSYNLLNIATDVDDNVWIIAKNTSKLTKLGKDTGHVLLETVDTFSDVKEIFLLSNGNILVISYTGTTITWDIRNTVTGAQEATTTTLNVTEWNDAVICE